MSSLLLLLPPLVVRAPWARACMEDPTQPTILKAVINHQANISISTGRVNQWNEHMKSAARGRGAVPIDH